MWVMRTVRGVGGGDVSHLMVALSSRPSSSTAAICGTGEKASVSGSLWARGGGRRRGRLDAYLSPVFPQIAGLLDRGQISASEQRFQPVSMAT